MTSLKASAPRATRGSALSDKRVVTNLTPHHQEIFEASAYAQNRSLSNMARLLIVKGMEALGYLPPSTPQAQPSDVAQR